MWHSHKNKSAPSRYLVRVWPKGTQEDHSWAWFEDGKIGRLATEEEIHHWADKS